MSLNNKAWKRISLGAVTLVSAAVLTACGGEQLDNVFIER